MTDTAIAEKTSKAPEALVEAEPENEPGGPAPAPVPALRERSLMIKNLCPGLTERGKIKIGRKGHMIKSKFGKEFQPPQKLDHFVVTILERDETGNFICDERIHKTLGEKPRRIPIRLLFDTPELNFQSRLACFKGRTLWCSGDGERAEQLIPHTLNRQEVACPCERSDPQYAGEDRCKVNGSLSVIIEGAAFVGGVWKFRTTSYNSVVGIMSSLALIRRTTGGALAGIPFWLTLQPKSVVAPDGKTQTVYVVGIEYEGTTEQLQQVGYEIALQNAKHDVRIGHIEEEAKQLLLGKPDQVMAEDEDGGDIADEFYPPHGAAIKGAPARPQREDFAPSSQADDEPEDESEEEKPRYTLVDQQGEVTEGLTARVFAEDFVKMLQAPDADRTLLFENNEASVALLLAQKQFDCLKTIEDYRPEALGQRIGTKDDDLAPAAQEEIEENESQGEDVDVDKSDSKKWLNEMLAHIEAAKTLTQLEALTAKITTGVDILHSLEMSVDAISLKDAYGKKMNELTEKPTAKSKPK